MEYKSTFYRMYLGVKKSPIKFIRNGFVAFTVVWTLLEPIIAMVPGAEDYFKDWNRFIPVLIMSLIIGIWRTARPRKLSFQSQNNRITIEFGDLFKYKGIRVIPVSRYMADTEVFESSLQYKLFSNSSNIKKAKKTYEEKATASLQSKPYEIPNEEGHKGLKRYSLGTSIIIKYDNQEYLLLAVTQTERKEHIPPGNSSLTNLWTALEQLWIAVDSIAPAQDVNIPLLGGGVTGIRLKSSQILILNILSLLNVILEKGRLTTGEIRIILYEGYLEDIDLEEFSKLLDASYGYTISK